MPYSFDEFKNGLAANPAQKDMVGEGAGNLCFAKGTSDGHGQGVLRSTSFRASIPNTTPAYIVQQGLKSQDQALKPRQLIKNKGELFSQLVAIQKRHAQFQQVEYQNKEKEHQEQLKELGQEITELQRLPKSLEPTLRLRKHYQAFQECQFKLNQGVKDGHNRNLTQLLLGEQDLTN